MSLNKRGFLLGEETLKIIIAIIAISFLIYLLFSLYSANRTSKDLELAKSSLNHLIEEINAESNVTEIYNPKNWVVSSWPDNGNLPRECSNAGWDNCLCICNRPGGSVRTFLSACETKGTCLENDFVVEHAGINAIEIVKLPLILTIDYENKIITQKEK